MSKTIVIPYRPRDYQKGLFDADRSKIKRFFLVLHRRGGKDISSLAFMVKKAIQKKGIYYYILPTSVMARNILWDNSNMMDLIPEILIKRKNSVEMIIELVNGSIIKLMGSDNYDRMRGTDPCGIVMSEYAFQHPLAWETLRPILANNGGWVLFNTTPNGHNHAKQMFDYGIARDDWYVLKMSVADTNGIAQTYLMMNPDTPWKECLKYQDKVLQDERENMDSDMFQQEYYCSFEGNKTGSYWGEQVTWLRENHRIQPLAYDPNLPVITYWDIGIDDMTAIWFAQKKGNGIYVIDYMENNSKGFDWYMKEVNDKPYKYGKHWLPHDFNNREIMTGKSRLEEAIERGWENIGVLPRPKSKVEVIDLARRTMSRCFFDAEKCKTGILCLENYHREYDELNKVYKPTPKHDWASHGADAFIYMAMANAEEYIETPADPIDQFYEMEDNFDENISIYTPF